MEEKFDLMVVSRTGKLPKGLEYLPIKKILLETCRPIGEARRRVIEKVETPFLIGIDDDVEIKPGWFEKLFPIIENNPKLGGIYGILELEDLGLGLDGMIDVNQPQVLKPGSRFFTNDVILRTEAIRGWIPESGNTICYEDQSIGNYIRSKGFELWAVKAPASHHKTWRDIARSRFWSGSSWRDAYKPTTLTRLKAYGRQALTPFSELFRGHFSVALYRFWGNFFFILGMLARDFLGYKGML